MLEVFDRIGSALTDAGVPGDAQFDATSVLVHFFLGVAGQYDAGTRLTVAPVVAQASSLAPPKTPATARRDRSLTG